MGNNPNTFIIQNPDTWIEGKAIQQFHHVANMPHILYAAGMPDLHPGRGYPIGAAFFSEKVFYPALIGNDIGCGMALWQTDITTHSAKPDKLAKSLGSIDAAMKEDEASAILSSQWQTHPFYTALGTIGGGNHFAELQTTDTIYRTDLLPTDFNAKQLLLLIHSDSRGFGHNILRTHIDRFGHHGVHEHSQEAVNYLAQHHDALMFARTNRKTIAQRMLRKWHSQAICFWMSTTIFSNQPNATANKVGYIEKAQPQQIVDW